MNTVINSYINEYGENQLMISDDDFVVKGCLASLAKNNTFCPNITSIYKSIVKSAKRDKYGKKIKDEGGKVVRFDQPQMTVRFADGTWTSVKLNENDTADDMTALIYAIVKRILGKVSNTGYVTGDGFMNKLKKFIDNCITEDKLKKEAEDKKVAKEAEDKKNHEDAEARKAKNPSIGLRLRNLEDKFEKLIETLSNK